MKLTSDHSFSGTEVIEWRLSPDLLELEVSSVSFAGKAQGHAKIVFPLSKPVRAVSFDSSSRQWVEEPEVERLKDTREFYFKKERHYSLKGVGSQSGKLLGLGVLSDNARITW